jgi:hypothetical protein
MRGVEMTALENVAKLLKRREEAVQSLLKSLEHLSKEEQFVILTSWLSIEELEKLAIFQRRSHEVSRT